jgi:hypothetical protein
MLGPNPPCGNALSGDPAENLLWRASTVFALAVGPVALLVVVLNPPFMNGPEFGPALGPCEVPVGHPALDVEGGHYVRLPRTTPLYLFLVDVQGFVDRECLVGPEDGPAVGDDGFGRAVALHRRVKDREVRREILAAKDPTCEDRPAVVLQNRDDVDVASQPVLYVADVCGLILVSPRRSEGHLPLLLGGSSGFVQSVEPTV